MTLRLTVSCKVRKCRSRRLSGASEIEAKGAEDKANDRKNKAAEDKAKPKSTDAPATKRRKGLSDQSISQSREQYHC